MGSSATELSERYGARSTSQRRVLVLVLGVLVTAFLVWLVWVMLVHGRPLARSEQISFRVLDENTAVTTLTVIRRDRNVQALCLLQAQSADHAVVGQRSFTVGPRQPATTTVRKTVRTEREATSVSVVGCQAEGQRQRR